MTKKITTYQDLLDEKQRLKLLLQTQKEAIRNDFREIKEELSPLRSVVGIAGKLVTRDRGGNWVMNMGANTLIDVFVKKIILGRAGWFAKTVVPFLLKNYSSHVINDNKESIFRKIFSWIGKKNANGKMETQN
jgi:hypothetical protein